MYSSRDLNLIFGHRLAMGAPMVRGNRNKKPLKMNLTTFTVLLGGSVWTSGNERENALTHKRCHVTKRASQPHSRLLLRATAETLGWCCENANKRKEMRVCARP